MADLTDRSIVVTVPGHHALAATVRLLVTSLGADVGFDLDEIDDLKLAVDEVFSSAVDAGAGRVTITFVPGEAELTVSVGAAEAFELDQLARSILASVVDEVHHHDAVTLVKRLAAPVGGS